VTATGCGRRSPANAAFGRRFHSPWRDPARVLLLAALFALAAGCGSDAPDRDAPAALPPPTSIGTLQGSGPRSPYEGQAVLVPGVVTGNFVDSHGGFFMQDERGAEDGDPATADGIFVAWSPAQQPTVRRGDRLRVAGTVAELGDGPRSQTAIIDARIEPLGRAAVAVTTIAVPPADEADWERFEGMWLRIALPLTVAGNYNLARLGELEVAFGGRPYAPTARYPAGARAQKRALRNATRGFLLDGNRGQEYPERLWFLAEPPDAAAPLRAGSRLREVEGILDHRDGVRRLRLTTPLPQIEQAPRPPPPEIDGALRLAQFNLLNWFNGDGRGGGFPTARGARDGDELARQQAKLVAMILALAPDIASLVELENDGSGPFSAQQALVDALNAALGADGDYRGVPFAQAASGDDLLRVGLIYRESAVRPTGPPQVLRAGPFADAGRPPLAQGFIATAGGRAFTVASAHFKSKRCSDLPPAPSPDHDQSDGQGCWNASRTAAATALGEWLGRDPAGTGSDLVAILGDLNANTFESPLLALRAAGWVDAVDPSLRDGYSYIFRGQANRLDHALLTPALARRLAGAAVWHSNADESPLFDYRQRGRPLDRYQPDPYRASDHDPLLVVLKPL
jgi:uncharacterized protein